MKTQYELKRNVSTSMSNAFILFLKRIAGKIAGLFEPEEVEVTFKVTGNKTSYTYTKVENKQVA